MYLTFIGAARTVTGSQYLFETNKRKFLVECGLYQGHRAEAERINRTFSFKPKDIQAAVLSHAHLDHSGNLPSLVRSGFRGQIYCTSATADIAALLLEDSAHIQENDIRYLNKKLAQQNLPLKEPLYKITDVEAALKQFMPRQYSTSFQPVEGVKVTFYDAGHILGSSQVLIETENSRVLFSGDLGRKHVPILKDPVIVGDVDYLMLESTYGNRTHASLEEMYNELRNLIEQGKVNRGKIIIPAFAVERTQLLVTMLKDLCQEGLLADIPVFIDSPLAMDITDIFKQHPECFDEETYKAFVREDPFSFPGLRYIRDKEKSKILNDLPGPMVIISASGMCEGGRILHHLIHSLGNERNIIVLTGFQAQGTLGKKLLDGVRQVSIFNDSYDVKAKIYFMSGLSAHADTDDLIDYVKAVRTPRLKKIFLVHGETEAAVALKDKIERLGMGIGVDIPDSMTKVTL